MQLSDQAPKSTKKQISVVWKYGKDIQSKCDAKKLATFAADVSDQCEMDQGVHVPNSTEGAHHLRRWAFLWRCVVHNKKYVLLDISWICTGAPERQSWSSTLDWIEVRIQLHANPITSLAQFLRRRRALGMDPAQHSLVRIRTCRIFAVRQTWPNATSYSDKAVSIFGD